MGHVHTDWEVWKLTRAWEEGGSFSWGREGGRQLPVLPSELLTPLKFFSSQVSPLFGRRFQPLHTERQKER